MATRHPRKTGFARTSSLLTSRIRAASESRGFAQSRLLTHWHDVVGEETAAISRPVKVSYGKQGFGATLTLLTSGAHAPILEMQKETLRARVNAVYGYNAITRLKITQTAPQGFSEGRVAFDPAPRTDQRRAPSPEIVQKASQAAQGVSNDALRGALEKLAQNVLRKSEP